MSEELLQTTSVPIGRYLFYKLGASTLGQLRKNKIIRTKFSQEISNKKPDCLIVLPGGDVKAVIEYKQPSEFNTSAKIAKAIKQEMEVAKQLCKLLIVTSGNKTVWINALNGEEIIAENGKELKNIFDAKPIIQGKLSAEKSSELESLIDKIDHSLSKDNNSISAPEVVDPSILAKTIWQKIWINTGKEPEKCLYNVVELFVFKFLSDVGVLKSHNNFRSVYSIYESDSANDALKHYANTCRREIKELFPAGEDGTTIINGTIFVNEKGNPNLSQADLFGEVLNDLQDYDNEFGSFKYIKREFKTRLYESFLRQEAGIRSLGQYFTPRNVVRAMVSMSNAKNLKKGDRICDPFCGVGGFLLEAISENQNILKGFEPNKGVVSPQITLVGYDKGTDEKEDERTIILAKANMLIYFSDLLVKYHSREYLRAFAEGAFNKVFKLLRSNLGTFGQVDDDPYDLILTNPPYVTSGSSSLKNAIDSAGLSENYTSGGRGTESLALEWIVRNLKDDGQALLVVPDGLMNQLSMLKYVKDNCVVQGIVSLPLRTFYSTPKKTYILILSKKSDETELQDQPIFTYLVSEIGETRDAKRFHIEKNDLNEAVSLFNQYKGAPDSFVSSSDRCKVIDFDSFDEKQNWMVDRWWDNEEKKELGIYDDSVQVTESDFRDMVSNAISNINDAKKYTIKNKLNETQKLTQLKLDNKKYFELSIGNRVLKKDILPSGIPVYSANVSKSFGFIAKSNLVSFDRPSLIWGIDGIFDWGYIEKGKKYASTDHCGTLYILDRNLHPKYIYYVLKSTKDQYGFDRTYRASLSNIKEAVNIDIPVKKDGSFDLQAQIEIANRYEKLEKARYAILEQLHTLTSVQVTLD